jgi:hypothetical protein
MVFEDTLEGDLQEDKRIWALDVVGTLADHGYKHRIMTSSCESGDSGHTAAL